MIFELHPQLAADTLHIADLKLCRVLLMNNSNFPWLILVPMRENMREIFDLELEDYKQVMDEIRSVSKKFAGFTGADKINVAALGNMVPQLHIHVIARFKEDAAWPNPVWNCGVTGREYGKENLEQLIKNISLILAE